MFFSSHFTTSSTFHQWKSHQTVYLYNFINVYVTKQPGNVYFIVSEHLSHLVYYKQLWSMSNNAIFVQLNNRPPNEGHYRIDCRENALTITRTALVQLPQDLEHLLRQLLHVLAINQIRDNGVNKFVQERGLIRKKQSFFFIIIINTLPMCSEIKVLVRMVRITV